MTPFIVTAGICLAVAVALAVWPLLRRRGASPNIDRRATNVDLYRQRVAEIEHDRDAGRISEEIAAALIDEQAATLLDEAGATETAAGTTPGRSVPAAIGVVIAIVAISLTMYHKLGAYDAVQLADAAQVLRQAEPDQAALGDLVMRLRTRVAAEPDDLESWYLLGTALMRLDDGNGAASAFEHVYAAEPDDPAVQVALAQARFVAADGTVTAANRALIDRILATDPQQSIAREMLALDAFRKHDYAGAARDLQQAIAGSGSTERTATLKQGLQRARALMGDTGPSLDVTIEIGDAMRNALPPSARIFVFARKPGQRMPLLVARTALSASPMTLRLDSTNAMQDDVTLTAGETLDVAARLSASGEVNLGGDDPQVGQDAVTLGTGVTPVHLAFDAATAAKNAASVAPIAAQTEVPTAAPKSAAKSGAGAADVAVRLSVAFAPGIAAAPPARVFVIVRAPSGPPMPIAVRALDPSALPQQLVLTDRDAMQPGRSLSMFDRVEVLARLSRSGDPMHHAGDVDSPIQSLDPRTSKPVSLIIGG